MAIEFDTRARAAPEGEISRELERLFEAQSAGKLVQLNLVVAPEASEDLCREIIIAFRDGLPRQRNGRLAGMTKVRHAIMGAHDSIDETGKTVEDPGLSRQDLENWIVKGFRLSSPKLRYVELFVQKLSDDPEYRKLALRALTNQYGIYSRKISMGIL